MPDLKKQFSIVKDFTCDQAWTIQPIAKRISVFGRERIFVLLKARDHMENKWLATMCFEALNDPLINRFVY
jgi:hypothetical protein